MSEIKRRDFLKTTAGVAAGAARRPDRSGSKDAQRAVEQSRRRRAPSCACCAGSASSRATRTSGWPTSKKFTEKYRHRGARRQRRLGGRAAEGGGRGQRRQRPRHHPLDQRRRATCIRTSWSTSPTSATTSARSTAAGTRCARPYLHARQEVDRRPAGLRRQRDGLSREPRQGGGLRQVPEGHGRLPQAVQGAEGEGHAGRLRARQRDRRRNAGRTGWSGRSAARWSTRRTRSSSTAPRRIKALEYAKELYATFVPGTLSWLDPNNNKAFLDGQISRHRQRHLDLLRGEDLAGPEAEGDGGGHPARATSRSARSACRPSSTCSSTR